MSRLVKEAARSHCQSLFCTKHLRSNAADSHDNPASESSILIIDLNPEDLGSLLETFCGGWVKKKGIF